MSKHWYAAHSVRGFANEVNVLRFTDKATRDQWVREHRHDGGVNSAACGAEAVTAKEAHKVARRKGNVMRDYDTEREARPEAWDRAWDCLPTTQTEEDGKMDRRAIERLARECAAEAVRLCGGDPTDSLLPARPLLGDYEALEELVGGPVTCREVEMFEEAYREALEEAQQA
jgi:hypothetical protein